MDRILMRHDDVNTFGVILYARTSDNGYYRVLYKDKECTEIVTTAEGAELLPKVSFIVDTEIQGDIFTKPLFIDLNADSGSFHKVYAYAPQMKSGALMGQEIVEYQVRYEN